MRKWIIIAVIGLVTLNTGCFSYADRVYVEDKGVIIPVDYNEGGITTVNNANGSQTSVYDYSGRTDIVHGDGTTTSIYD